MIQAAHRWALPLVLAFTTAAACARASQGDADVVYSAADDAALIAASAEAQKTLPVFWSRLQAKLPGYAGFRLKVLLPTDDGRGDEALWMTVERRTEDGQIIGRLSNAPISLHKLSMGSTIEVDPSRVADWTYQKGGKAYGHFTTRALYDRATPEQRAEARAMLSPTPLENETH